MALYNLEYKDHAIYTINLDFANKDISIQRTKAGNIKTFGIKDFGTGLVRDEVIVSYYQTEYDSEGDPLYNPGIGRTTIVNDAEYFSDMIAYTNATGIVGQAKLCVDVLLKQRLQQTRCFNIDGDFIHPVYFTLSGSDNTLDPSTLEPLYDGYILASIDVSANHDLNIRFMPDGSTWSNWFNITEEASLGNLGPGGYTTQIRATDVSLLIEPQESVNIA